VISTHPAGRSNWLERDLLTAVRERFALRISHVVVDLGETPEPPETVKRAAALP
jgi:hypothetical protein